MTGFCENEQSIKNEIKPKPFAPIKAELILTTGRHVCCVVVDDVGRPKQPTSTSSADATANVVNTDDDRRQTVVG